MVDSLAQTVVSAALGDGARTEFGIAGISGGMAILPNGDVVVTSMFERKLLQYRNGLPSRTIDLADRSAGTIDDMIADDGGRMYVGDLGIDLLNPNRSPDASLGRGRILLVQPDGSARVVAEGLSFPNGIAISGDGTQLVVAESDGDRLSCFDVREDGSLVFRTHLGSFGEPDGVCFDRDNAIWVSLFKEDAFVRIDLGGRELQRVLVDGRRAVACVLGGADRRTLLAISADTSHQDLIRGKSCAIVEAIEVEVPGAGFP
jgi:sugar lactone lactonase YvrE